MNKARKELARVMKDTDVIVEVLDARIPAASSNPLLAQLRGDKPVIRILNKADLAEPAITEAWLRWFSAEPGSRCLTHNNTIPLTKENLLSHCRKLLPPPVTNPNQAAKPRQILIVGIPNVGKSTLLNQILDRKVAKTGNEPAVTKGQQRVKLDQNWVILDTPGLLWPKLEDQTAAYRLALTGTIRNTAVQSEDIAWFAAEVLLADFYPALQSRYNLQTRPVDAEATLDAIARNRGCVGKNRGVDWHKVSDVLLNDFRSGKLGPISLERPPEQSPGQPAPDRRSSEKPPPEKQPPDQGRNLQDHQQEQQQQ